MVELFGIIVIIGELGLIHMCMKSTRYQYKYGTIEGTVLYGVATTTVAFVMVMVALSLWSPMMFS